MFFQSRMFKICDFYSYMFIIIIKLKMTHKQWVKELLTVTVVMYEEVRLVYALINLTSNFQFDHTLKKAIASLGGGSCLPTLRTTKFKNINLNLNNIWKDLLNAAQWYFYFSLSLSD